jgi:hypothetical protein
MAIRPVVCLRSGLGIALRFDQLFAVSAAPGCRRSHADDASILQAPVDD